MGFLKKYKTIFIIVIVVIAGGIAYNTLFKSDNENLLTSDIGILSSEESAAAVAENDLLNLLLDIRSIKLDGNIFSKETFKSLEDFGQEIIPEPVGRENPFAPIGFVSETSNKSESAEDEEKVE